MPYFASSAVFDGQDAVLAHAALHCLEHVVKALEIHDAGGFEDAVAGDLGIGALNALTGHHGPLGEELGRVFQGFLHALIDCGLFSGADILVGTAGGHDGAEKGLGIVRKLLPCLFCHPGQHSPLPARGQSGHVVLLFKHGDFIRNLHTLLEKSDDFVVDLVDLASQLFKLVVHVDLLPSIFQ